MVKLGKKELEKLGEAYVLKMFQTGSDPINYNMLKMVPSTTEKMRKKVGLSKMPFYVRVKRLKEAGLIEYNSRDRSMEVEKTKLTDQFFYAKERIEKQISKNPAKYFQLMLGV